MVNKIFKNNYKNYNMGAVTFAPLEKNLPPPSKKQKFFLLKTQKFFIIEDKFKNNVNFLIFLYKIYKVL